MSSSPQQLVDERLAKILLAAEGINIVLWNCVTCRNKPAAGGARIPVGRHFLSVGLAISSFAPFVVPYAP